MPAKLFVKSHHPRRGQPRNMFCLGVRVHEDRDVCVEVIIFFSHVFHLLANRPRHWCTVAGGPLARSVRRVDAAVFRCIKEEHLLWAFSLHRCWLEVTRSRLYSSGRSSNKPRVCVFFGGTLFDGRLRRETRSFLRDPCLR